MVDWTEQMRNVRAFGEKLKEMGVSEPLSHSSRETASVNASTEPYHCVEWFIDGDTVWGRINCRAPKGAFCRLKCAEDCGAEEYPCYTYNDYGENRAHELVDGGHCNAVEFITNSGCLEESYHGAPAQLRNSPVEIRWHGDYYGWNYPEGDDD